VWYKGRDSVSQLLPHATRAAAENFVATAAARDIDKIPENRENSRKNGIFRNYISQRKNASEFCFVRSREIRILFESFLDFPDEVKTKLQSENRAIVGSLMHLYQWTHPDLVFAVTFLSLYLHKPGEMHLQAANHVQRYLKGTVEHGIRYTRDRERLKKRDQQLNVLYALSDSDFAGCKDTFSSTSGYIILANGGVVTWVPIYSGRHPTIALCTAMAETIALAKLVSTNMHKDNFV
jgi:hypothetical protein